MRKLKPCPKCGADNPLKDYLYQTAGGRMSKRWYYECRECHASTKDYRLITEAANAWNAGEVPETRIRFRQLRQEEDYTWVSRYTSKHSTKIGIPQQPTKRKPFVRG